MFKDIVIDKKETLNISFVYENNGQKKDIEYMIEFMHTSMMSGKYKKYPPTIDVISREYQGIETQEEKQFVFEKLLELFPLVKFYGTAQKWTEGLKYPENYFKPQRLFKWVERNCMKYPVEYLVEILLHNENGERDELIDGETFINLMEALLKRISVNQGLDQWAEEIGLEIAVDPGKHERVAKETGTGNIAEDQILINLDDTTHLINKASFMRQYKILINKANQIFEKEHPKAYEVFGVDIDDGGLKFYFQKTDMDLPTNHSVNFYELAAPDKEFLPKFKCPNNPEHKRFYGKAVVSREQMYDEYGNFLDVTNEGEEVDLISEPEQFFCCDCEVEV